MDDRGVLEKWYLIKGKYRDLVFIYVSYMDKYIREDIECDILLVEV